MKIKKMTKEMRESLPIIRDKWIGYGISTKPIDRNLVQKGVDWIYKLINLPLPRIIVLSNPYYLQVAKALYLNNQLSLSMDREVRREVDREMVGEVADEVRREVDREVVNEVVYEVGREVGREVDREMVGEVADEVRREVADEIIKLNIIHDNYYLYYWNDYLAYAEVFKDRLSHCKKIADIAPALSQIQIINPTKDVCFVSERPITIHRDNQKRLHNANGPALEYAKGFKLYRWHGIAVPSWCIEQKEKITAEKIQSESNQEIRRCMLEIMGGEAFVKELGAQLIHEDRYGRLWSKQIDKELPPISYVELVNSTQEPDGTNKIYWLRVDPQSKTCHEAVGRSFLGDRWAQYNPEIET